MENTLDIPGNVKQAFHMTNKLDTETSQSHEAGRSKRDQRVSRKYLKEFGLSMALYIAAIFGSKTLDPTTTTARVIAVAICTIPVLLGPWAIVRAIKRGDEYEKLVQYRGLSIGFATGMITSLVCALSLSFDLGLPALVAGWAPFMAGMTAWGISVGRKVDNLGAIR